MATWKVKLIKYKPSIRGIVDGAVDVFWEVTKQKTSSDVIYNNLKTGVCSVEFNEQNPYVELNIDDQNNVLFYIWNNGVDKTQIELTM